MQGTASMVQKLNDKYVSNDVTADGDSIRYPLPPVGGLKGSVKSGVLMNIIFTGKVANLPPGTFSAKLEVIILLLLLYYFLLYYFSSSSSSFSYSNFSLFFSFFFLSFPLLSPLASTPLSSPPS